MLNLILGITADANILVNYLREQVLESFPLPIQDVNYH